MSSVRTSPKRISASPCSAVPRTRSRRERPAATAASGELRRSAVERDGAVERSLPIGRALTALVTTLLAFLIGGLVVLVTTGSNPLETYKAIFDGTGLNWLFPGRMPRSGCERPGVYRPRPPDDLADPHRARGGVRVSLRALQHRRTGPVHARRDRRRLDRHVALGPGFAHILLALVMGVLAGALLAGIAGILKATVGAHEVIVTIMLNWIVYWFGTFLFGLQGPLQNTQEFGQSNPVSDDIAQSVHLPVFWGNPILQGLHIGFFIAIGALVFYWVTLNRTTLGYEVRAVGFNPEAARYGGISVARNYFLAMAISGAFAGLAGAIDILGWQFRLAVNDVQISTIGFIGIAVALLGRNTAVGVGFAALLFGALLTGTSTRNTALTDVFDPNLADNLTLLIQGLVVLFVGAGRPRALSLERTQEAQTGTRGGGHVIARAETVEKPSWSRLFEARSIGILGIALGVLAVLGAAAARASSALVAGGDRRRGSCSRHLGDDEGRAASRTDSGGSQLPRSDARHPRDGVELGEPEPRRRLVSAHRGHAAVCHAADVRRDRRDVLRAKRRREHRSRGRHADGRVLRVLGDGRHGSWSSAS